MSSSTGSDFAPAKPASARYKPWLWINLLSLDAPVVALLWQAGFARTLHVDVRWPAYIALGISVWLIYAADRTLDAFRHGAASSTPRHNFYYQHWRAVGYFGGIALSVLAIACHFLTPAVLHNGVATISVVVLYFAGVHLAPASFRYRWPKELAVGVLFSTGTCLATWTKLGASRQALVAPAVMFAALCWLNCVAIEFWEWTRHPFVTDNRPHPWTVWMGRRVSQVALLIAAASLVLLDVSGSQPLFVAALISAVAMVWLHRQSPKLSGDALRVLADVALLSPAFLLGLKR